MHVVHCKAYVDFLHCSCDPGKPLKIQPFLKLPKPVPLNGREIVWLKTSKAAQQHHAWISCQHLLLNKKNGHVGGESEVESGVWLKQSWARQGVNLTLLGRLNRPFETIIALRPSRVLSKVWPEQLRLHSLLVDQIHLLPEQNQFMWIPDMAIWINILMC